MYKKAKVMKEDALRNQQEAAKLQKKYYDSGARPEELKVGDLVRVYDSTAEGSKPVKFRNQWVGPYFIRGKKDMLFELEEMEEGEIKSLFHQMKLKQVNEERPV